MLKFILNAFNKVSLSLIKFDQTPKLKVSQVASKSTLANFKFISGIFQKFNLVCYQNFQFAARMISASRLVLRYLSCSQSMRSSSAILTYSTNASRKDDQTKAQNPKKIRNVRGCVAEHQKAEIESNLTTENQKMAQDKCGINLVWLNKVWNNLKTITIQLVFCSSNEGSREPSRANLVLFD